MSRALILMLLLVAGSVAGWGISVDPGIIYNTTSGTTQSYTGIGIPFFTSQSIFVDALGAFDNQADGLTSGASITVTLQSFTPGNFPTGGTLGSTLASVTLNSSSPSGYGSVWQSLGSSVSLSPGWYIVVARGFTTSDPTIGGLQTTDVTLDTLGGIISYGLPKPIGGFTVYGIYWEQDTNSGWNWNSTGPIHIAGGTFSVPEPSTYALMGTVGFALYLLRRWKASAKKG